MGLDTVELVMEVEDAFSVSIADDVAERILTVGDLYQFLLREKDRPISEGEQRPSIGTPDEVWLKLREIIVNVLGVPPEDVRPEARWIEDLGAD